MSYFVGLGTSSEFRMSLRVGIQLAGGRAGTPKKAVAAVERRLLGELDFANACLDTARAEARDRRIQSAASSSCGKTMRRRKKKTKRTPRTYAC